MIPFLIISLGIGWAFFALYSPKFNYLDEIEKNEYNKK